MPRAPRRIAAGVVYHVLNRAVGKRMLFSKDGDYRAFVQILAEGLTRFDVDLLSYCLMGNHWHLLIRPRTARALPRFMAWITVTHARRHHMHYPKPGSGHLYQGRFKSFPVQSDGHFLIVARYLHANPRRAGLVKRAQAWRWSDLGSSNDLPLADWPVDRPRNWIRLVNDPFDESQEKAIHQSLTRGTPFGSANWIQKIAKRLHLTSTLHPRGRPKKSPEKLNPRYRRSLERKAEKSR